MVVHSVVVSVNCPQNLSVLMFSLEFATEQLMCIVLCQKHLSGYAIPWVANLTEQNFSVFSEMASTVILILTVCWKLNVITYVTQLVKHPQKCFRHRRFFYKDYCLLVCDAVCRSLPVFQTDLLPQL